MATNTVRTTLTLPVDLLEAVDQIVRAGKARSRNDLVTRAVRHELAAQQRAAIDAAFAEMARDPIYQAWGSVPLIPSMPTEGLLGLMLLPLLSLLAFRCRRTRGKT